MIHAVFKVLADWFACEACEYEGDLTGAVRHAVANQFIVPKKVAR